MQERGSETLYLLFGFCDPQPILKVLRLRWATAVSMVQSADLLLLVRFSPSIRYRGTTNSSVFVYLIRLHPHHLIFPPYDVVLSIVEFIVFQSFCSYF